MADALADEGGPGPAAIGKYVAPRALLWFRMAAAATWLNRRMGSIYFTAIWLCANFSFSGASRPNDELGGLDGDYYVI